MVCPTKVSDCASYQAEARLLRKIQAEARDRLITYERGLHQRLGPSVGGRKFPAEMLADLACIHIQTSFTRPGDREFSTLIVNETNAHKVPLRQTASHPPDMLAQA